MTSFGHHVLRNRYRFEGDLELVTGLRLSTGRASDESDAPLMRTRAGELCIPGSSLRGGTELRGATPLPLVYGTGNHDGPGGDRSLSGDGGKCEVFPITRRQASDGC